MILSVLYSTILGYLIGNMVGICKALIYKETSLWSSRFYIRYVQSTKYLFPLFWGGLAVLIGGLLLKAAKYEFFIDDTSLLSQWFFWGWLLIPAFFFVSGVLIWLQFLHYFDRVVIFPDRIEKRWFFHTFQTIELSQIKVILRDKTTGQNCDIIYVHPFWGLHSLGSSQTDPWPLPVSVIISPEFRIDQSKLHPNLFEKYKSRDSLPEYPILMDPVRNMWNEWNVTDRIFNYSILLINPYVMLILSTAYLGMDYHKWLLFILFDTSTVYSKFIFHRIMNASVKTLNPVVLTNSGQPGVPSLA